MSAPALSFVVAADRLDSVRLVLRALSGQSIADRIEVVLVLGEASVRGAEDPVLARFGRVAIVEASIADLPAARAIGVAAASTPIVAFGEAHAFPQPGWAEAIVEAHAGPWGAVGPSVVNANPGTALSWAGILIDYGPWVEHPAREPLTMLPGHNTAYKTERLRALGERLPLLLAQELQLTDALAAGGDELLLEPAMRVAHVNVSHPRFWLRERFCAGRVFAADRARAWSGSRRAVYAVLSPLIPIVRFLRIQGDLRRVGDERLVARVLPPMAFGLLVSGLGEGVGYATGEGRRARDHLHRIELHRFRYLRARDRRRMARLADELERGIPSARR